MASQTPGNISTCVMCFESRTLKAVGRCKHTFCAECLSSVLEGKEEVFQCPTCLSDCPRPWNGVDGLVDVIGVHFELAGSVATAEEDKSRGEEQIICEICDHKIKEKVKAVNICQECDHLNICQACSEKHKKSKATRHHILTPIETQQNPPKCDSHKKNLVSFCHTCSTSICKICVSTDHEDHDVERLGDTIWREFEKTNLTLDEMEGKVKMLQNLQQELVLLNAMAPQVDKQDVLFKQVEDRAQEVIDHIIRWKEYKKQYLRVKYQIIQDIPDDLGKVSEMVDKLQTQINQARKILSKTEHQSLYLEKLFSLKDELEQTAEMGNEMEGWNYRDILHKLRDEDNRFQVNRISASLGEIVKKNKCVDFRVREIFHHTIPADSEDMFIPCVATLGPQSYAVAHPVAEKGLPTAIDIYDYEHPGLLKRTLRDGVLPFHDMSTTPDNQLALLCDGADGTGCRIQVVDPETGNITSSHDIISDRHPISLGVTILYQYVILESTDEQQAQITVTDGDGTVKNTYRTDEEVDIVKHLRRMSCGGQFIFVGGMDSLAAYEIKDTGTQKIITKRYRTYDVMDIAATIWDDLYFTDLDRNGSLFLNILQDTCNTKLQRPVYKYMNQEIHTFPLFPQEGERQARVATTRDGNTIIVSRGQTIEVYRCQ